MRKIILAVTLIAVAALLSSCGTTTCCGSNVGYSSGDGCCGSTGYGAMWY